MFIKISGKGSSELITELFICSFEQELYGMLGFQNSLK